MIIKWKRIEKITNVLMGMKTHVTVTAKLDEDVKACIVLSDGGADILINSGQAKTVHDVLMAISHEIAHKNTGLSSHEGHGEEWNKLYNQMREMYNSSARI